MASHYLDRLFAPRSIAVFGASDKPHAVGARVYANLLAGDFKGPIHPINPGRAEIGGRPCQPSIAAVREPVDLAVIATPAETVPGILHECGEHGVRAAIVVSAGLGNGPARRQVRQEAARYGMRVLGPNCLGLIRPHLGLNATFSNSDAKPGSLALVSQSGALCTAILDWAERYQVGFSALVSLGEAADLGFGDVLDYLALDAHTKSILLYVEGIQDARRFMSGLRVAARLKPVVVVKSGRHATGARAAVSHTGALVGSDDAFDAALRRAGVVRVLTIEQLFSAAQLLAAHHRVRGDRLAIVTNAGGPGVLAADRAADLGVRLAEFEEPTRARLDAALPEHWSKGNPIDILGDAPPARYRDAVQACLADRNVDGVLVMLTPQAMTEPTAAAREVLAAAKDAPKPVLTCWLGETHVREARDLFTEHRVPTFPTPEASVEAFAHLAEYQRNQKLLLEVPGPLSQPHRPDVDGARLIIEGALRERRDTLGTTESKALLAAFGIPVAQAIAAATANDALIAAESLGFPVAMKIDSSAITHKADVDGVRLDIRSARDVRGAFHDLVERVKERAPDAPIRGVTVERMIHRPHGRELLVGVVRDAAFGPVISFGAGGTAVEILRDRSVALPPLNPLLARDLISRTRVSRLLRPFRHLPAADLRALEEVLLRVSDMVCELPEVRELDINPLVADESGAVALDARVVVADPGATEERYGHMAIHPYPTGFERRHQLPDGTDVTIRPIRPEDAEIEAKFVRELSPRAKYFRFMRSFNELTPEMLIRFTQIDYDREMAFIAVTEEDGREVEIGVARYTTNPDGETCEFAIVVSDAWQGRGVGTQLMTSLIQSARRRRYKRMDGEVLHENSHMLRLMERLGFTREVELEDNTVVLVTKLL